MKIKSFLAKPYASVIHKRLRKAMANAVKDQEEVLRKILSSAANTIFGKEHDFKQITDHKTFADNVPIRDYEAIKPYIELAKDGKENVLWHGRPMYWAKTSGTTSGIKYIPITKESISNHIDTAKLALLCYIEESGNADFANGKMIFLSGSPELERTNGIPTGRLSGIVNHFIPTYLRTNQLPSYTTNCIEDWESKLGKIVTETMDKDMSLISGIPPWMQMYFDWLQVAKPGKSIKEIFPNLQVLVHGGVNFEPYKAKLFKSIGKEIDTIETFPASEGFFAFQDKVISEGLLLNTNSGIYFEFVPASEIFNDRPTRLSLAEIEMGVNYALVISSNAGLWAYNIGDTVKFVSKDPYRLVVTGRTKHYISAFGEHVIAEEVEQAMEYAASLHNVEIVEFTVAPQIETAGELPYHEWLVAFAKAPDNLQDFAKTLDGQMRAKNIYYTDLIAGSILQPLKVTQLQPNAFRDYMKSIGKLGGQNKVPRLSNDRVLANALLEYKIAEINSTPKDLEKAV